MRQRKPSGDLTIVSPSKKERKAIKADSFQSRPVFSRTHSAQVERQENRRATLEKIEGAGPNFLTKQIEALRYAIEREKGYPTRPVLREKFETIQKAAHDLREQLRDLRISAFFAEQEDDQEKRSPSKELLAELDWIANRATSILDLNPRKQGRRPPWYPADAQGPSPHELCALFIGMTLEIEGRWPGKRIARLIPPVRSCGRQPMDRLVAVAVGETRAQQAPGKVT
jgi:hypothetical protein